MALRINVCSDRTAIRLGGAVFGIELELGGETERVAGLAEPAALAVAERIATALLDAMRAADVAIDEETLVFVGVPDGAIASYLCEDEDFGEFAREVAQACVHECERIVFAAEGPRIETGWIESFALWRDADGRERVPQLAPVLEGFEARTTDTLVLPLVLVTNEGSLERASDLLTDGLDFSAPENGIAKAIRAALAPLRIEAVSDPEELGELIPEDEEGGASLPDEDVPFVFMACEQERSAGERALHAPDELAATLPALQASAARTGAAQFAYSSGVPVVVTADAVYLGFKTVDDLGRQAEIALDEDDDEAGEAGEDPFDGERIARRWARWYVDDYRPRMEALEDAGFAVSAFPTMSWSDELDRCIAAGEPFVPGAGTLVPLEDVYLETSDHDLDESAEAACAVYRVMADGFDEDDDDVDEDDDERMDVDEGREGGDEDEGVRFEGAVLCGAVRIVAADGTGISQQNVYVTKKPGSVDLDDYVRSLASSTMLPVRAGLQSLLVCDTHLRLMVAVDSDDLDAPR